MQSWIIALPRQDLLRCIEIGCFGKEKLGDRISEVRAGDGIACYALKESKIIALGEITRGYYIDEFPKFLKDGLFSHRFDFSAELLGPTEVNVLSLKEPLTSIPAGGNLGLLVKSGFRILTRTDWEQFCKSGNREDLIGDELQKEHPRYWWCNQDKTYRHERAGGYIWAPQKGKNDQEIFHHMNVSQVVAGDVIWHYSGGSIVAKGLANQNATSEEKPLELQSEPWSQMGFKVSVTYHELEKTISRDAIPSNLKTALSEINKGPFNKVGTVNQGYLYSIPQELAAKLIQEFPQLAIDETGDSNELDDFCRQIKGLKVNVENGSAKAYKPAMLLAVVQAIGSGHLQSNRIEFDWTIQRFKQSLREFDATGGDKQAANAFYYLRSEPFWNLEHKGGTDGPSRGEPAELRRSVDCAYLNKAVWNLLQNERNRTVVEQTIRQFWIPKPIRAAIVNTPFNHQDSADQLIEKINRTGFKFEPWQIACYLTALRTKPFLILAGVSGSGKSQLPALIAKATGGISELITVRPDWTDSSDVLGYVDLAGKLRPGQLLSFAKRAIASIDDHHVCIVDEMNLAKVEHYFAEILSRIEESRGASSNQSSLLTHVPSGEDRHWGEVYLPANLALIGTVNMDESSHGFSRKVLDRAFTLEFSEIDLASWENSTIENAKEIERTIWPAHAWNPRANSLNHLSNITSEERADIQRTVEVIVQLNEMLTQAQLQLAYRSRDEIALFVLHSRDLNNSFATKNGTKVDPLDLAIQMKVLPRISGGSGTIRTLILEMLGWAHNGKLLKNEDEVQPILKEWVSDRRPHYKDGAMYPRTCARLCLMWERIEHEGYASYWL